MDSELFSCLKGFAARASWLTLGLLFSIILAVLAATVPGPEESRSKFFVAPASAQICGGFTADSSQSFNGTIAHPDTIKAAVVWISFADSNDCNRHPLFSGNMPPWFRDVEVDLEKYIAWQSYGKLYLDVKTAQQPAGDSLKPWNLGNTACHWRKASVEQNATICPGIGGNPIGNSEGCINRRTVDLIDSKLPGYFNNNDITRVFFIHLADSFHDTTVGGWGSIQYQCSNCPYGDRSTPRWQGTVQRPVMGNNDGDEGATKWMLSHEFGHTLL